MPSRHFGSNLPHQPKQRKHNHTHPKMQDVRKDIRYMIESILRPDSPDTEAVVDRFYASNAILLHPAFTVEGKEK